MASPAQWIRASRPRPVLAPPCPSPAERIVGSYEAEPPAASKLAASPAVCGGPASAAQLISRNREATAPLLAWRRPFGGHAPASPAARILGGRCRVEVLLFDLDGTLYPVECGYQAHFRRNLYRLIHTTCGLPADQDAEAAFLPLFRKYNQALKAVTAPEAPWPVKKFDVDEWYVQMRRGAELFLRPDPEVIAGLAGLPQRKVIFTNTHEIPAREALELLGLADAGWEAVIGVKAMAGACKPDRTAFEVALAAIGCEDRPEVVCLFEDSFKNLRTAKELGMRTVFVRGPTAAEEGGQTEAELAAVCDAVVSKCSLAELSEEAPFLFPSRPL